MADMWDFPTRTPLSTTQTNYPLKGELATLQRGGAAHNRWHHKPTVKGTARIWFCVDGHTVFFEQVHTESPERD